MTDAPADAVSANAARLRTWIGVVLLAAGLAAHLLSAQAIGGLWRHYRDHVGGFVLIGVVFGPVVALVGRRFWRGRPDITLLIVGVIQAVLGLVVWINRFSIH
jgi:hypothetical protein